MIGFERGDLSTKFFLSIGHTIEVAVIHHNCSLVGNVKGQRIVTREYLNKGLLQGVPDGQFIIHIGITVRKIRDD